MEKKIDFVVPYVDNQDQVWRDTYIKYCQTHNMRAKIVDLFSQRYNDNVKLIDYQLKLVEKNMPFINKIYLLVSNIEQVPQGINKDKVVVVLHKDFIPPQYLPTFNSTTIEMFLWNVPNVSEYFVYANDDMLPTQPLKETDFFDGDIPKVRIEEDNILRTEFNQFRNQCLNSHHHILDALHIKHDQHIYEKPIHSMTPMIKSHCKEAYELIKGQINPQIRAFRTDLQHNQYIYPIYEKYAYKCLNSEIDFLYTELKNGIDLNHQIVCINIINEDKAKELKKELNKLCE